MQRGRYIDLLFLGRVVYLSLHGRWIASCFLTPKAGFLLFLSKNHQDYKPYKNVSCYYSLPRIYWC